LRVSLIIKFNHHKNADNPSVIIYRGAAWLAVRYPPPSVPLS
jgi:hypothetical protein